MFSLEGRYWVFFTVLVVPLFPRLVWTASASDMNLRRMAKPPAGVPLFTPIRGAPLRRCNCWLPCCKVFSPVHKGINDSISTSEQETLVTKFCVAKQKYHLFVFVDQRLISVDIRYNCCINPQIAGVCSVIVLPGRAVNGDFSNRQ